MNVVHFPVRPRGAPEAFATDPAAAAPALKRRGRWHVLRVVGVFALRTLHWLAYFAMLPFAFALFAIGRWTWLPLLAAAALGWLLAAGSAITWWLTLAAALAAAAPFACALAITRLAPARAAPKPLELVDYSASAAPPAPTRNCARVAARWMRSKVSKSIRSMQERRAPGKARLRLIKGK